MINSIQSYQNTSKLTTNKAKANNSPNFGMKFNYEIAKEAGDTIRELQSQASKTSVSDGFLYSIKTLINELVTQLRGVGTDADSAKLKIKSIQTHPNPMVPKVIRGSIVVEHDGLWDTQRFSLMASKNKEGLLSLDSQSVKRDIETLLQTIKTKDVKNINPQHDLAIADELSAHLGK